MLVVPMKKSLKQKIRENNLATIRHMNVVRDLMYKVIEAILERYDSHDKSKLVTPEAEVFAEFSPELEKVVYGSPEYNELLEKIRPAITHHYANNRHHPEHWPNGVDDMTLIDLLEMLCDWKASTARNKDGNIRKSVEINAKRFQMSEQLTKIFENTVRELFPE